MDQIYQGGNKNVWLLLPFLHQNWYITFLGDYGLCIPLLWHCFTWSFNSTWWRWRFLDALISYSTVAPKLNHFIPLLQSQTYFIIFLPQNSFRHNMESGFIYLIKYAAPFRLRRNVFKLLKIKAIFFRNSNALQCVVTFWLFDGDGDYDRISGFILHLQWQSPTQPSSRLMGK